MILSFSVFRDKIESGEKRQTIRKYSDRQWKIAQNAKKYQLYWHNPRNGGTPIKEVERSQEPLLICFYEYQRGFEEISTEIGIDQILDNGDHKRISSYELAKLDGFSTKYEMFNWFYDQHGKEMYQSKFIVYRWL